ncbi:MAG: NACHT domain-containing protein [Cyanobacteria bacterium P01_B01_bin.77]
MAISLRASPEGITLADSARKIKGWTKTAQSCCDAAHTSVATLKRFWQGNHIRRETFIGICSALEVDWRSIAAEAEQSEVQPANSYLDNLIQRTRETVKFNFEGFEYGSSINQQQHLHWIQHNFIDLDLIEVTYLPSEYPVDDPSLLKAEANKNDDYDRLGLTGLSSLKGNKTNSHQVLNNYHNIFLYGEPGSGKSTYLKWIALKCREGELLDNYVPIFIEIRRFAAMEPELSLVQLTKNLFKQWDVSAEDTHSILSSGRAVFIFDGFDETPAREWTRINRAIEKILLVYSECRFICSSRLATQFPSFNGFQKIIIAPFDSRRHIPQFIQQWFRQEDKDESLAQAMLEKLRLRQHHGIRELARRPILLKMLCVIFERNQDFPTRRAEVFSRGIDQMMSSTHQVETRLDKMPTLGKHHVEKILRRIANHFFVKSELQLLFEIKDVEKIIVDYFEDVYDMRPEEIPAEIILNGIEQSTGLIVRWAKNLCAFSHLTYQEFFVADNLVRSRQQNFIYQKLNNSRWNFVVGLVSELLPSGLAEDFLSGMKQEIDKIILDSDQSSPKNSTQGKTLSEYLNCLDMAAEETFKSIKLDSLKYKPYIRAWYFAYALENFGKTTNPGYQPKDFDLPDLDYATSIVDSRVLEGHELIYQAYHYLSGDAYSGKIPRTLKKIQKFLEQKSDKQHQTSAAVAGWLSSIESEQLQYESKSQWWSAKRDAWLQRLVNLMNTLRLPCISDLTKEQVNKLRTYYESTKLLSTCMNRSRLNSEDRGQLIDSMLIIKMPSFGGFVGFGDGEVR